MTGEQLIPCPKCREALEEVGEGNEPRWACSTCYPDGLDGDDLVYEYIDWAYQLAQADPS
jgi:hypothetical protein